MGLLTFRTHLSIQVGAGEDIDATGGADSAAVAGCEASGTCAAAGGAAAAGAAHTIRC